MTEYINALDFIEDSNPYDESIRYEIVGGVRENLPDMLKRVKDHPELAEIYVTYLHQFMHVCCVQEQQLDRVMRQKKIRSTLDLFDDLTKIEEEVRQAKECIVWHAQGFIEEKHHDPY